MNIIFAHNSHNRPKTLINTINEEKKYFPNSIFYLSVTKNGTINEEIINDMLQQYKEIIEPKIYFHNKNKHKRAYIKIL